MRQFRTPLEGALFMRAKGFQVFPVKPNDKTPAVTGWQDWAQTASEQKVEAYGKANPTHNWGVYTGVDEGLLVVDIDNKLGKGEGTAAYRKLLTTAGAESDPTLRVDTPSGGIHLYFVVDAFLKAKSRAEAFGVPYIDVKSTGGYVVSPGSRIGDRSYTLYRDVDPIPAPKWMLKRLANGISPEAKLGVAEGQLIPAGLRNEALTSIAGVLRSKGCDEATLYAALVAFNLNHLQAPVEDFELRKIAHSVAQYAPGVATVAMAFQDQTQVAQSIEGDTLRADTFDPALIPPRPWVMYGRYIRGFISVIVSPGGVGKSMLTMLDAVSIVTGQPISGSEITEPGPVWLYNTEDPMDELKRRMIAIAMLHGTSREALKHIHVTSGQTKPFILAKAMNEGVAINEAAIEQTSAYISQHGIGTLIVDPFVQTHEVRENDNMQISKVIQAFKRIATNTNCAIGIVHHTRKGQADNAADRDVARGASSLVDSARISHNIRTMTEDDAKELGVKEEQRSWYFRLDTAKANLHPPAKNAEWFEKKSLTLLNGDSVGALENVKMEGISAFQKAKARRAEGIDIARELAKIKGLDIGEKISIHSAYKQLSSGSAKGLFADQGESSGVKHLMTLLAEGVSCVDSRGKRTFRYEFRDDQGTKHWVVCEAGVYEEEDLFGLENPIPPPAPRAKPRRRN